MNEEINVRGTLAALEVGSSESFPLTRLAYIRAVSSNLALERGIRFTTSTDRATGTITVTRTA